MHQQVPVHLTKSCLHLIYVVVFKKEGNSKLKSLGGGHHFIRLLNLLLPILLLLDYKGHCCRKTTVSPQKTTLSGEHRPFDFHSCPLNLSGETGKIT